MDQNLSQIVDLCSKVDGQLNTQTASISDLSDKAAGLAVTVANQADQIKTLQSQLDSVPQLIPMSALDDLQLLPIGPEASAWVQPSNAGNTGGASDAPHGTFTLSPGDVATLSIKPAPRVKPGDPYDNFYWYTKRKGPQYDAASRFLYCISVQFPDSISLNASEGIEFDLQQSLSGKIYNPAWQILHPAKSGNLRTFNKVARQWVDSGLVLPPSLWKPGSFIRFIASYVKRPTGISYEGFMVNGKQLMTKPIVMPIWTPDVAQSNYLSMGYQMDANGISSPYTTKISKFSIIYG